ncbi:unnamed protein product [Umbelopsis vinacea]
MSDQLYDYLVIGGGSGGLASARRASGWYNAKVALVEASPHLGGTCVNVGCVPRKSSSIAESLREAKEYGFEVNAADHGFNWKYLKDKRDAYIRRLNGIYEKNLNNDKVDYLSGYASFVDKNTVKIQNGDNVSHVQAKKILVAVGGHPIIPDLPGADLGINSDGFFDLEHQPKRVAVIGTGYIGIELAGIFHTLGSDVTIFSRTKQILRSFDPIIKDTLLKEMQNVGVNFAFDADVRGLSRDGPEGSPIKVHYTSDGKQSEGDFDCVLWAVGRLPNVKEINLEAAGIVTDKKGHIVVDEFQNTSTGDIFALGDVCGHAELTPVAIAAGRKLSDRVFGPESLNASKLDYNNIPTVVFAHPTAGTIGLTEEAARRQYGDANVKIYTSRFVNLWNAMLEHKEPTAYKLVCTGPEEKVVGLHIIGRGSDEILQGFAVAIKMGATKADFDSAVAIHPTAAEEISSTIVCDSLKLGMKYHLELAVLIASMSGFM